MNTHKKGTSAHGRRHEISPRQVKAIHAATKKLGLDDTTYRARLATYGAKTCKDLTWQQAEELLDDLNGKNAQGKGRSGLGAQGSGQKTLTQSPQPRTPSRQQYADLDGRPGFASGKQLRLVAAMFSQVTRAPAEDPDGREKALNSFCYRIAGVTAMRMVRTYQVEKIVKALEAMGAVKKEG